MCGESANYLSDANTILMIYSQPKWVGCILWAPTLIQKHLHKQWQLQYT